MKVNISYTVEEPARSEALRINAHLQELEDGPIRFTNGQTSTPHITIAMGSLRSSDDLTEIVEMVRTESRGVGSALVRLGKPYREKTTGRYVFADADLDRHLRRLRDRLGRSVTPFFVEPARTSDTPHLTLGHVEKSPTEVDDYLSRERKLPKFEVRSIDICEGGPKGTRGRVIEHVELK